MTRAASGLLVTTYSGDAHLTELSATAQLLEALQSDPAPPAPSAAQHNGVKS